MAAWPQGNSSEVLRQTIVAYLQAWLAEAPYQGMLPSSPVQIMEQGAKQNAGIRVLVGTGADAQPSRTYYGQGPDAGHFVIEEYHKVSLLIRGDAKNGGSNAVGQVQGALRNLFFMRMGTPESIDLIGRGVFDVMEDEDALEFMPTSEDEDGTWFSQKLELLCNTNSYLN